MPTTYRMVHASCAAWEGSGVLLVGPPGAGKSDLLLRLLGEGWALVADDQVRLVAAGDGTLHAEAPEVLAGMVEARGLGLLTGLPHAPAPLRLVAELAPAEVARLPLPRERVLEGGERLPLLALDPFAASAPQKLRRAVEVLAGRLGMAAGAFAA